MVKNFHLNQECSIDYYHNNYIINKTTIKDLKNYVLELIKPKLKNLKYPQIFVKYK